MFKLMKYEVRKNIWGLVFLLLAFVGCEGYFVVSSLMKKETHTAMAIVFLTLVSLVAYFFVLIYAIVSYSKELTSKTSYLTFMTPISSAKIIGSKIVATIFIGVFLMLLIGALAFLDMMLMENCFPETKIATSFLEALISSMGYNPVEFWLSILGAIIQFGISFLSIIAMAYFAVTLSATVFQNKKFKGFISFAIFIIVDIIMGKLVQLVEELFLEVEYVASVKEMFLAMLPGGVVYLLFIIASLFASAKLLDKKVSL